jgi:DNA-binding PadR family transcriptional regulator
MVSSDTTRMLVLGVARMFEPANGYQLRRELLSWQVEEWAHINPGSIYSMLSTLTKQGMLERADLAHREGARPVAVYTTTEAGRQEIRELISAGLLGILPFDQTGFYAALSLMVGFFDRAEVIDLLGQRVAKLDRSADTMRAQVAAIRESAGSPPHVAELLSFSVTLTESERGWLDTFLGSIRAGGMAFLGEPAMDDWKPLPNDPAWAMVRERETYLAQLGGTRK